MMALCNPTLHPFDLFPAIDDLARHARSGVKYQKRTPAIREPSYSYQWEKNGGTLEVEMPGVRPEDISVEVQGRNLKVTGKRYRGVDRKADAKRVKAVVASGDGPSEELDKFGQNGGTENDGSNVRSQAERPEKGDDGQNTPEEKRNTGLGDGEEADEGNVNRRSVVTVYKSVFRLNNMIDPERVEVERYRDGVLRLCLGRMERAEARKIVVK